MLFLFFVMALLIKSQVPITGNDTVFYALCVGTLSCAIFVVPMGHVIRCTRANRPSPGI